MDRDIPNTCHDVIHAMHTVTSTPPYPFSLHKSKLFMPSRVLSHQAPCAIKTPRPVAGGTTVAEVDELFDVLVDAVEVGEDCINVAVINHFTCGCVSFTDTKIDVYVNILGRGESGDVQ
jgi:hypothetical protein